MVGGGDPLYLKFGSTSHVEAKSLILNLYSLVASAVTPSKKKVQLTLIGSSLRAFQ